MSSTLGMTALARHFQVPVSAVRNWIARAPENRFPEPVRERPREWSVDDVASWVELRREILPSLQAAVEEAVEKGGWREDQWPLDELMTRGRIKAALNLKTYPKRLVESKGFPEPVSLEPVPVWDAKAVLGWALLHRHRKGLQGWVHGTWFPRVPITPPPGTLPLEGVAVSLGVTLGAARYYAYNEPTFPDEVHVGLWDEEDVAFWREHEAPDFIKKKLDSKAS